ncbi:hypothetical protein LCGC14_0392480 [marine sediment metagenome]|uniref:Phage-like element PBSX protein XkdF domain-containing protein n=1 Tax=marine sediment metagenome TaxID=412755 RepID=A0A0F9T576_9ZZZZ
MPQHTEAERRLNKIRNARQRMSDKKKKGLAVLTTKRKNDFPDSSFLLIGKGGKKDEDGKTVPRGLRKFPVKDEEGKLLLPQLRNAIARIPQATGLSATAKQRLQTKARTLLEKERKKRERSMALSINVDATEAVGEAKENEAGQKVQRFKKEIIRDGTYTHPVHDWTLKVDESRRESWKQSADKMISNGVAIPIPISDNENHHEVTPQNTGGYVVGLENDGESLYAICEMIGEDAIKAVARNDVSVFIEQGFKDGKKRSYGEAITHVALTPTPIVPGMDGFIKIAASLSSGLTHAAAFSYDMPAKDKPDLELSKMDIELTALQELLDDDKLTEDNVLDQLGQRLEDDAEKLTAKDTEIADLKKDKPAPEPKLKLDPDVEDNLVEAGTQRLDSLVDQGRITPAVKEKLAAALIGPAGNRNGFAMSRKISGSDKSMLNVVCEALAENNPVELAKKVLTGSQHLELSRIVPDDEEDDKPTKTQQSILDDMMPTTVGAGDSK